MATYNRAKYIMESIKSIQDQTFKNWECIIIDDGGADDTEEILEPLLNEDKRFKYLKRTSKYKKGLPGSRNYGLDEAKGDYIIFFDDDDIVHPQNIEICVNELTNNLDLYFCHYQKQSFKGNFNYNQLSEISNFRYYLTDNNIVAKIIKNTVPMASCTVLWRKECFSNLYFNEKLQFAEEWECFQRILCEYWHGIVLDCVLYFNRKHSDSNTGEYWKGNQLRMKSKINAAKLIITNLEMKNKWTPELIKYFSWLSVQLNSYELFSHLINQSSLSSAQRLKEKLRYNFSPLIKLVLRIKKRLS
ncbi:MAG: glycosyl transferase family 2 [Aequorivita sp.]|nr:glycosyl transferase family 2 [Aequorivita sp.]|tara:strand:+ start:13431 stop:14336 length:906 start_codon:yes stop_codon:yes gene_type:complete